MGTEFQFRKRKKPSRQMVLVIVQLYLMTLNYTIKQC
jgi:hypothetical protein